MAVINVPDTDNFDIWRQKTNLLATQQGDIALLITINNSNLVASINEIKSEITNIRREVLIRAIAMS